jgi:hypothetical protein
MLRVAGAQVGQDVADGTGSRRCIRILWNAAAILNPGQFTGGIDRRIGRFSAFTVEDELVMTGEQDGHKDEHG